MTHLIATSESPLTGQTSNKENPLNAQTPTMDAILHDIPGQPPILAAHAEQSFKRSNEILHELIPGTRSFIELEGSELKFDCAVIGYKKNQFIILTIPSHTSVPSQNVYSLLYNGNTATFYIMLNGKLSALKCNIIRFTMDPSPLLFLSFPTNCTILNLRQSLRVRCLFRAALRIDTYELNGMITDLSIGGCGFICPNSNTAKLIEVDAPVSLECTQLTPANPIIIPAKVRSASPGTHSLRIGIKFTDCPDQTLQPLQTFISDATTLGGSS
jgi:hypothetical protein